MCHSRQTGIQACSCASGNPGNMKFAHFPESHFRGDDSPGLASACQPLNGQGKSQLLPSANVLPFGLDCVASGLVTAIGP